MNVRPSASTAVSDTVHLPPASAPNGRRWLFRAYLALWFVGTLVPLSRFLPWLNESGFDPPRFVNDVFGTPIGAFFGWDVIIAVVTLIVLAIADRELPPHQRLAVGAASLLGASCGLPLYLLFRERRHVQAWN